MKQERLFLIALVVLAVLASIPQIPVEAQLWGAILAIVGIAAGVLVKYGDAVQRVLIYVLAVAIPTFDNCLDYIWVVGPWINAGLDNLATGIQGVAVGILVMALLARIQGSRASGR